MSVSKETVRAAAMATMPVIHRSVEQLRALGWLAQEAERRERHNACRADYQEGPFDNPAKVVLDMIHAAHA